MKSKLIVITGATGCVGSAAARRLARDGHRVVVVGRSADKTTALAQELRADCYVGDFSRLRHVRELAERLLARYPCIDVLANNAGALFAGERRVTPDGHELTFQVNYLAGFVLATRLMGRLIESRGTVICTSGFANRFAKLDLHDLEGERRHGATKAYCNSKLEQILFARELDRRYGRGRGIASAAFDPGIVAADAPGEPASLARWLHHVPIRHPWAASPDDAADTLAFLAEGRADVDFPSGQYFFRRRVAKANPQAYDRMLAFELWNRCETMVDSKSGRRELAITGS